MPSNYNQNNRTKTPPPTDSAVALQDRLHELLNRLSSTVDLVRKWPGSAGDDDIHTKTTSKLIDSIRVVLKAVERVESTVQHNHELRTNLNACPVPVDLLDLLDHGGGLNPECFARGLLQEALGQLEGLKRRKSALERLAVAVEAGLETNQSTSAELSSSSTRTATVGATLGPTESSASRKRDRDEDDPSSTATGTDSIPAAKKIQGFSLKTLISAK